MKTKFILSVALTTMGTAQAQSPAVSVTVDNFARAESTGNSRRQGR
jgi:hypothetical protein